MKKIVFSVFKCCLVFLVFFITVNKVTASELKPEEVKKIMKRVADWQIENMDKNYSGRESPHHQLFWGNAAFYIGLLEFASISNDETYYEWLKEIGNNNKWKLHKRKYHADDHTVGQLYIDLFRKYGDEKMIEPTKEQFEFILYHPSISVLNWRTPFHLDRWNWCDALFMSPQVWAKLYHETKDERYLVFLMNEFKATTDFLFDKKESLYYRDERFKTMLDNDTKVFWSRGNGWVFAGIVNIMKELEPNSKEYKYFKRIYTKMSKKLLELQTPQGHWAMSLLGQEFYPTPETSGSSFFIYGMAWGINNGILDKEDFLPAITKGWNAMVGYVNDDGMLGYVQPIGAAPGKAWPDKTETYGSGSFLSAGAEVYKLLGGK